MNPYEPDETCPECGAALRRDEEGLWCPYCEWDDTPTVYRAPLPIDPEPYDEDLPF